jgi:hypothetical protein
MDSNTGGILGIFAFLTSAAGLIYTAINHKRIRCRCCGKDLDMSVDVDPTDKPKPKPKPSQTLPETASAIEILPRNVEKEVTDSDEESPKVVLPPRRPNRLPKIAPY